MIRFFPGPGSPGVARVRKFLASFVLGLLSSLSSPSSSPYSPSSYKPTFFTSRSQDFSVLRIFDVSFIHTQPPRTTLSKWLVVSADLLFTATPGAAGPRRWLSTAIEGAMLAKGSHLMFRSFGAVECLARQERDVVRLLALSHFVWSRSYA